MICELKGVSKQYQIADQTLTILQKTDLQINEKEFLLIIGPSGSGKTTLLSLIGCVIYPTTGELTINGQLVNNISTRQMAALRLKTIGFVFQNFNLLAPLTAAENVRLPLDLLGYPEKESMQKAEKALDFVGMLPRKDSIPKKLSGGQQQRVAIARALITEPKLVLCDEPTASLDKESAYLIMKQLRKLADEGQAVIVVTHDPRLKEYADRIIAVDGGVVSQGEKVEFSLT
jgi:putative ABC transport system ATP-binding protein